MLREKAVKIIGNSNNFIIKTMAGDTFHATTGSHRFKEVYISLSEPEFAAEVYYIVIKSIEVVKEDKD